MSLCILIDDIIVTGPDSTQVLTFIHNLAQRFSLKDLGSLSYFLGVEVQPCPQGLFLNQRKYTLDLLEKASMLDAKLRQSPPRWNCINNLPWAPALL